MGSKDQQEEYVQKLEQKLNELRQQRIKVDEANETLRKRVETLTSYLDSLDAKYGKNGNEETNDKISEEKKKSSTKETDGETETGNSSNNQSSNEADNI